MKLKPIALLFISITSIHATALAAEKPAFTWHEYRQQLLELNKRTLTGSYKQLGKHGAWDDQAIAFLDQSAVYFSYRQAPMPYRDVEPPSHSELIAAGEAVISAGCDDPLVAHCLAVVFVSDNKPERALPLLRTASPRLAAMKYPDVVVYATANRLADLDPKGAEGKAARKLADERLITMAGGKLSDIARRRVLGYLRKASSTLSRENQAKLVERLRQRAETDPWIVDTLDGEVELRTAWDKRGGGFAREVSQESRAGFNEHARKARMLLDRAWRLAPQLPEAPTLMIEVAIGLGPGEDFLLWFDRAKAAQLDFSDAYDNTLWGLLPHWHGDYAAMYELGLSAAQTKRFDTNVPWQLVRALRAISMYSGKLWGELSRPGIYEQIADVIDGYVNFHEGSKSAGFYKSTRIALAWRAGKYGEAKRLLGQLEKSQLDLDAFKVFDANDPAVAVSQIHALTGATAAIARQGESAIERKDWANALEAFVKFHERWDVAHADPLNSPAKAFDDPEHAYADQRIRFTGNRAKLAVGQPVVMQPDETFEDWTHRAGEWSVAEDGAVHGRMVRYESPYLIYQGDVGKGFELTGSAAHTKGGGARAAILLATDDRLTWIVFYERAVLVHFPGGNKSFPRERSPAAKFSLRFEDARLTVRVNDQLVIDRFQRPDMRGARLGIGTVDDFNGESIFRGLTVRQLTN